VEAVSPEAASFLADKGIVTILLTLLLMSVGAIAYLFRQLSKEREMCATDWRTTVAANTLQMKEWTTANEPRTRALEANVRALELMTAAIDRLTSAVDQSRDIIITRTEEAIQSNRSMREALLTKGVTL
jgi:Tfp pilus assembly protein PilV